MLRIPFILYSLWLANSGLLYTGLNSYLLELVRYNLADLHTHSFCSDGLRTPTQAVEEALRAGVQALSLTDHDTVEGVAEVLEAGQVQGVDIVPGTELSAHVKDREVHILAYCVDWHAVPLLEHLELLRQRRHDRGAAIVERLNDLGVELTLEEVLSKASGGLVGRPHIAAAMISRGVVATKEEAFVRFLGDRAPAVVPKPYTSAQEVMALVHQVGGVTVLAHPGHSVSEAVIGQLVDWGLDGIEVFHPSHQPLQIEFCQQLAQRHDLLQSGGSDSHGEVAGPRIGDCGIGCEAVEAIRDRAAQYA
jgi:predicted metal-dependent phosphoesterase TrpH